MDGSAAWPDLASFSSVEFERAANAIAQQARDRREGAQVSWGRIKAALSKISGFASPGGPVRAAQRRGMVRLSPAALRPAGAGGSAGARVLSLIGASREKESGGRWNR
ncbi:hypothetical protein [Streptomyces sp. NPDC006193]|uniref:hypothetical protein n=1 Tax=Streptomyces sp. NPDC006193 TaxID=3155717 RepID=UPI0033AA9E5F